MCDQLEGRIKTVRRATERSKKRKWYKMSQIMGYFLRLTGNFSALYIQLVYWSSKVIKTGDFNLLSRQQEEKFIFTFWHGENYCFYPIAKNKRVHIITTVDTRGNYVSSLCEHFGYIPIRVPDITVDGAFFFKIRKKVKNHFDLAISLDGPLGPFHEPKVFPFVMALFTKYRIVPISIRVKRKIQSRKRWDQYTIPLPFNRIELHVHDPIEIERTDLNDYFLVKREKIRKEMESM